MFLNMRSSVGKIFVGLIVFVINTTILAGAFSVSSSSSTSISQHRRKVLAVETSFKLPSPLSDWPPGQGFATDAIDLGGLQVSQVSSFEKIWATREGGPDNQGATFYDPTSIPEGFSFLGSYSQPNNRPLFGHILVGKDVIISNHSKGTLKQPIDYTLVWGSESLKIQKDGNGYFWLPTPPDGYAAVGYVVTNSSQKPPLDKIQCVRSDFTDSLETDTWLWGFNEFNFYTSRPRNRGVEAMGATIGSFVIQNGDVVDKLHISCLKNVKGDLSTMMPNLSQINSLIQAYSPVIYFHPHEVYLPCSVDWFFQNGALVYHQGEEFKPNPIEKNGANLPQGGSNDDSYWLDLPTDGATKDRVKKGDMQNAEAYFHVKPMYGGLFTDIAIWVFYAFNGPSRVKVGPINVPLGKIGEHVGDWEHVTLRVSNLNGELNCVFFSHHNKGTWVSASVLEYEKGNKPIVYSSLHGHASYPRPGILLVGPKGADIGLRQDMAKSDKVMDTGIKPTVVAAKYLGPSVVEPPWLKYERKWGPKIDYDVDKQLSKVDKFMIGELRKGFKKFVSSIPREVLGEEGPIGPRVKNNWNGDEDV